jgi:hypothetical protein
MCPGNRDIPTGQQQSEQMPNLCFSVCLNIGTIAMCMVRKIQPSGPLVETFKPSIWETLCGSLIEYPDKIHLLGFNCFYADFKVSFAIVVNLSADGTCLGDIRRKSRRLQKLIKPGTFAQFY